MFPAQYQSPTTCSFISQLTLASINARHSQSPTTAYSESWMPDYLFGWELPPHDFQSNARLQFETSSPSNRAGLGIHYPDPEFKLSFSPQIPSFSPIPTFEDADSSLNQSSWSLTMLMPQGCERPAARNSGPSTDAPLGDSGAAEDLSLESLSAAAGLSVEEFTDKITQGAKYALKKVADFEHAPGHDLYPLMGVPSFLDIPALATDHAWFPPCLGINPADVMPAPLGNTPHDMFRVLGTRMHLEDAALDFPRPSSPALLYPATPPAMGVSGSQQVLHATPQAREEADQLSDYEPPAFLSPSSSEYSPSLGSSRPYHTRGSRIKKRKIPSCAILVPSSAPAPGPLLDVTLLPPINLGSPVFDAHRGIEIEDLKARAERYRLRNQGREYDKRWLLSFAGKLSTKGELREEFRCYITGCQQVNKRRDHILIHVGAHLDQRPFKCVHCSARFLRKNECKRHELSHTGIRPFTCHLCTFPATTFVRQDLLRRHMKRTHQIDEEKENKASSSRPRKKAKKF